MKPIRFPDVDFPNLGWCPESTAYAVIAYSIDARGHVIGAGVIESNEPHIVDISREAQDRARYEVPADWAATGGPKKRFRIRYVFQLAQSQGNTLGKALGQPLRKVNYPEIVITGNASELGDPRACPH